MSAQPVERTVRPWYRRTTALIVGAGAVATALLSLMTLMDRIDPPADPDIASIESVAIMKRTALTNFAPPGFDIDLPLQPVPDSAERDRSVDPEQLMHLHIGRGASDSLTQRAAHQVLAATLSPAGTTPSFPDGLPAPLPDPIEPTTAASPEGPPAPSLDQVETPTAPAFPKGTTAPAPSSVEATIHQQLSQDFIDSVMDQRRLEDIAETPSPGETHFIRSIVGNMAVNDDGELLPPAEVAAELQSALAEIEVDGGTTGADPLGWTLAVRLDIQGLANVPLLLTWSLDGVDVPDTWEADNVAYRIVSSTPHDTGLAEIWVPDLLRTGAYNVNVKLSYEADGTLADAMPLGLPNN